MAVSQNVLASGPTLAAGGKTSVAPGNNASKPNLAERVASAVTGSTDQSTTGQALTADNRKNDNLLQTKSQKDIPSKSKENVHVDDTLKPQPPVKNGSDHRSASASSMGSRNIRRSMSKVLWNIMHARDYPIRAKRPDPPKRVLPPVPDPNRIAAKPEGKGESEGVRLICRVRPSTTYAQDRLIIKDETVEILPENLEKSPSSDAIWTFPTDKAFYGGTQQEIYDEVLHPSLQKALDGLSSLVMLCGRKGTGKTYTCRGDGDKAFEHRGLIPRALQEVFHEIQARAHEYDIRVSLAYYDLVGENMLDLLTGKRYSEMTESTYRGMTYVKELAYARVNSEDDALFVYFLANYNRRRMRPLFSGKPIVYHTIFTLYFEIHSKLLTDEVFKVSKLTCLELGCITNMEHLPKIIPSHHDILLDTNKSVGLLEKAMSLRLTGDIPIKKIPCRQSKLVYALKDILTDETGRITVIACISPERHQLSETISNLQFASRFKGLCVFPRANLLPDHQALLRTTKEQAEMLKTELRMYDLLNARESPDYTAQIGPQDIFRTAREVKDFVDGRITAPKLTTYRQLENFLGLMKKLVKDGDLPTEPVEIPDQIPGRDNVQVTLNEDDGKVTPAKDGLENDGVGELDDKDGVGTGVAPGIVKGKNVKSLMKKKKEEKTLKLQEKVSVINTKKLGAAAKKSDKNAPATSPLKEAAPEVGRLSDPAARPDASKLDETQAGKAGESIENKTVGTAVNGQAAVSLAVPHGMSIGGSLVKIILKAIPKPEAYQIFTTKIPIGMEPFRVVETHRQLVAAKEKAQVTLAEAVNNWIEELDIEQYRLEKFAQNRARTRPQTAAKIPVLTFEEYKTATKIRHMRYLIETGQTDISTCNTELCTLKQMLTDSRRHLLTSFEEWYGRTYDESVCDDHHHGLNSVSVKPSIPLAAGHELPGLLPPNGLPPNSIGANFQPPVSLSPFSTMIQPGPETAHSTSLSGALLDASQVVSPLANRPCAVKLAPRDTAELHKRELESFMDCNPEAAVFYRTRDKVRSIIRVREENEAHHQLHARVPPRKLDPDLTIIPLLGDLPMALKGKAPTK